MTLKNDIKTDQKDFMGTLSKQPLETFSFIHNNNKFFYGNERNKREHLELLRSRNKMNREKKL